MSGSVRVGIDFDNTIASYDELMLQTAIGWGLLAPEQCKGKREVRDQLRRLPDGELHWRKLQTYAYGEGMVHAKPNEGVREFLSFCAINGIPVWIVSHKTEFNNLGPPTVNFRRAAFTWLVEQGFFDEKTTGLTPERVFFESTREEKVARIASLAPTHFIDDLEETFLEPGFPACVCKIHYLPNGEKSCITDAVHAPSWSEITKYIQSSHG